MQEEEKNSPMVIMGFPVDNLSLRDSCTKILAHTDRGSAKYVATANLDFIKQSLGWPGGYFRNKELLRQLRSASIVTADGMPLVWASYLLGTPLKERVTGIDLVRELLRLAEKQGKSVYLLGGSGNNAEKSAQAFRIQYPKLEIAGFSGARIDLDADNYDSILNEINSSEPDILLIALGCPKQELWFKKVRKQIQVPVSIGVGGVFEFVSGQTKRAPTWMQGLGLEWIYRLTQDPGRLFKRYSQNMLQFFLRFVPLIAYVWIQKLIPASGNDQELVWHRDENRIVIRGPRRLGKKDLSTLKACVENLVIDEEITLDCENVSLIDPVVLAFLMREDRIKLRSPRRSLRCLLKLHGVWDYFENRVT